MNTVEKKIQLLVEIANFYGYTIDADSVTMRPSDCAGVLYYKNVDHAIVDWLGTMQESNEQEEGLVVWSAEAMALVEKTALVRGLA